MLSPNTALRVQISFEENMTPGCERLRGGKTLLATQILGETYRTLLKDRRGAGLILWVVPSDQIYKDTLRRLRDRTDFYRESLEFALSRRIEVWEKHEISRLTPGQLASCLRAYPRTPACFKAV